jgi:spermidine synthase
MAARKERPEESSGSAAEAWALYAVVFVSGTILMSAEIAGSRLLNPFFGSAIFVWGSLIGVVMVALAAGYYLGGRIADVRPSLLHLLATVGAAGLFLMLMPLFSTPVCSAIARTFHGPRAGPLLASVVLLLVPGVLLAAVTPFAVRLSARDLSRMGNVAGRISALSTAGSIVGTLGTAFALIPLMGTRQLVFCLGAGAIVTAAGAFVAAKGFAGRAVRNAAVLLGGLALVGWAAFPTEPGAELTPSYDVDRPHSLVEWKDSAYHLILVTRQQHPDPEQEGRLRPRICLRFNDRLQSAIYTDVLEGKVDEGTGRLTDYSVFESAVGYTDFLHLGLVFAPHARKVLFVGGGGGIGPTEFVRDYDMEVEVAEIDPEVERIGRNHFHVHPRVQYRIGDGRRVLESLEGHYDLIVLDAYSSGGHIPAHLTTKEFLELCRSRLSPGGAVVSNVIAALSGEGSAFYQSEYLTMYAAGFANVYAFPKGAMGSRRAMNIIIVATQDGRRMSRDEIVARARELTARPAHPVKMRRFADHAATVSDGPFGRDSARDRMPMGVELTDDYCPVDTMYYDR